MNELRIHRSTIMPYMWRECRIGPFRLTAPTPYSRIIVERFVDGYNYGQHAQSPQHWRLVTGIFRRRVIAAMWNSVYRPKLLEEVSRRKRKNREESPHE